ncbi:NAD(P)-dependent oxidoreductase [Hymenobacter weizhouensis]|uniref:NAD(P)-dependent oxidoreductase n=1 Tax=Hymenobacter sp. YIM 151500-1 TaxID=2987689 RepID=UPI00222718A2|nr:SDR family oxidoreductase [Hymenobacter sp. YIM 151500-1]UYZ64044.1 SDR family oxidoreductase [Hymenobacter sp. YIM 151500-1]
MKTIALFGASGKTGQQFLPQALAQGYKIKALVRTPAKLSTQHPNLEVIQGDVLDPEAVARTVQGTDVVVSLFGHVKGSPEWLQTDGTRHIVRAMQQHGVQRIISLSGGGLPTTEDKPKLPDHLIRGIMKLFVPKILNDAIRHADVLRQSPARWTIVRGPRLTDEPRRGQYRVGWVGVNASTSVGRADLADFLLKQVEDEQFVGKMPFVSY